jgi:hypothetical protein
VGSEPRAPLARLAVALLAAALACPPQTGAAAPSATDKETARALMTEGDHKVAAGDLTGALAAYQGAHTIMGVPTTGIELARTQIALSLLVEARDTLLQVMRFPKRDREPAPFSKAREQAEKLTESLVTRIPTLRLVVSPTPPDLAVKINGQVIPPAVALLPRKVNPGTYSIVATASGYVPSEASVTLKEAVTSDVPLTLRKLDAPSPVPAPPASQRSPAPSQVPASPPSPQSPQSQPRQPADDQPQSSSSRTALVYGGFAVGALGVVAGTATGLVSLSSAGEARGQCDGERCPESARASIVSSRNWALVSNLSFVVGAVGAGVGLITLLTTQSPASAAKKQPAPGVQVHPVIGAGEVGVWGTF